MKNIGIHVLDFNDKIIDYISRNDNALIVTSMKINKEDKSETFDFTISSERAEKLRERNRIIAQDNNGKFKEFIITLVSDNFDGTTDIESNASYLEDLAKSKPIKPSRYKANTTSQALSETLRNTGWEVSDDIEYGGQRTTSWSSYVTPYDLINQLCTTYKMEAEYYVELGSHTIEHRYVSLKKPVSLFKGKEITKDKDLKEMKRTVDLSEVRTALYAIGPEKDDGTRIELIHVDDEAQSQFGLPGRYLWGVYEPQSEDTSMSKERLLTLAKTRMNKVNKAAISYEISSVNIDKFYSDVEVTIGDTVRIKDRDFKPALYVDAEVVEINYDLISDNCEFKFGNIIEYNETDLRNDFTKRLDDINKKLNDKVTNINAIVNDAIAGELEYFERKIIKSDTPPEKPVEDMLWYDTSNPNVAVIKRYHDGEWRNETAKNVEQLGGMTREQVMFASISNTFENLSIQHSKLLEEVYQVLENKYLVDDSLKAEVNQALDATIGVYNSIKNNLSSMTENTATIGKLIDTQTLFLTYREKLQVLYDALKRAKYAAEDRLKLLQSQYTDEKFNDAMVKIANSLPNGEWDSKNQQLIADIPNQEQLDMLSKSVINYVDSGINNLSQQTGLIIDSKVQMAKDQLSMSINSIERKIDGIEVGGRNLIRNSEKITDYIILASVEKAGTYSLGFEPHFTEKIPSEFGVYYGGNIDILANDKPRITHTFEVSEDRIGKDIRLFFGGTYKTHKDFVDKGYISKVKLEYGNVATDWTPAPEDIEDKILNSKQEAEEAAKGYAKAQDELKQTETKAYADGIVSAEEERAIQDAIAKRDEAKKYADQKSKEAQEAANQNTQEVIKPITTRVTSTESDVKILKGQIGLMAKSDDVTQQLKNVDGRLTPLETTVKSNKATLNLLPDQINSKVSKQDYTTDQNKLVTRLNNADSERKQLSNSISDKVSLTEYNNGINGAKSYTDNKVNNISVGSRNVLQSYRNELAGKVAPQVTSTQKFTTQNLWASPLYSPDYFRTYFEPNTTYTISYEMTIKNFNGIKTLSGKTFGLLLYDYTERKTVETFTIMSLNPTPDTSLIDKKYKFTKTFKTPSDFKNNYNILGYSGGYGDDSSNTRQYVTAEITNLKIEKGTMATDWTPAPEDVEILISNSRKEAEEAMKEYSDAQDNLKEINLKAYADGIVSEEEKRAIQDAKGRLEEAKTHANQTAEAAQQASQNYTNNEINNLNVSSENLLLDSEHRDDFNSSQTFSFVTYRLEKPLEVGEKYTFSCDFISNDPAQSGSTSVYPYSPRGNRDNVKIENGKVNHTFTATAESTQFLVYKDIAGQSLSTLDVTIEKAILVKGDKISGWQPSNSDIKNKISQAETNANAYTDQKKSEIDQTLTKMNTSITQNGKSIELRATKEEFNASKKTLSSVVSEITNATTGINLNYDVDGSIQSYTMDKSGIKLKGDKVDITVNKDFNVMAGRVNDKVGKNEIINRLNLSSEGLDIDVNKIGIRGGNNKTYLKLSQDKIELAGAFNRTWRGDTQKDSVYMRAQGGLLRFRNNTKDRSLYYSDFGISTYVDGNNEEASGSLQFFDYTYSTARGVTLNSSNGVAAVTSDNNRVILDAKYTVNIESSESSVYIRPFKNSRVGVNEFRFWTKLADKENETDGVLSYGAVTELPDGTLPKYSMGASLRFEKNPRGGSIVYATNVNGDIGTGDFYGNRLFGDLTAKNDFAYVRTNTGGRLRITDFKGYNDGNPTYTDLQCHDIQAESIRLNSNDNFYVGVSTGELRVTNNLKYNGGKTGYKPVRASGFNNASLEQYKTDIKKWNYDALTVIANDLDLYQFKYKDEEGQEKGLNHRGVIIGKNYKTPDEFIYGDGVNLYEMVTWSLRAIQQLNEKINTLEEQLNEQSITS